MADRVRIRSLVGLRAGEVGNAPASKLIVSAVCEDWISTIRNQDDKLIFGAPYAPGAEDHLYLYLDKGRGRAYRCELAGPRRVLGSVPDFDKPAAEIPFLSREHRGIADPGVPVDSPSVPLRFVHVPESAWDSVVALAVTFLRSLGEARKDGVA